MVRRAALILLMALISCAAWAQGLVLSRGNIVPVVEVDVWRDEGLRVLGGVPVAGVLLGYRDGAQVGYQVGLEWRLSPSTSLSLGGAYLSRLEETRLGDVWDKLGVVIGVRLRM